MPARIIQFPRGLTEPPCQARPVQPDETADIGAAARVLLRGLGEVPGLFAGRDWEKWSTGPFVERIAPYLLKVAGAARDGNSTGVAAADAAFGRRDKAAEAVPLRAWDEISAILPASRKLAAAVRDGSAAGHLHTLLALRSAAFHTGDLALLQTALFAEWPGSCKNPASGKESPDEFLRASRRAWSMLPRLLSSNHAPSTRRSPAPR